MQSVYLVEAGDTNIFTSLADVVKSLDITFSKTDGKAHLEEVSTFGQYTIMYEGKLIGTVKLLPVHTAPTHL